MSTTTHKVDVSPSRRFALDCTHWVDARNRQPTVRRKQSATLWFVKDRRLATRWCATSLPNEVTPSYISVTAHIGASCAIKCTQVPAFIQKSFQLLLAFSQITSIVPPLFAWQLVGIQPRRAELVADWLLPRKNLRHQTFPWRRQLHNFLASLGPTVNDEAVLSAKSLGRIQRPRLPPHACSALPTEPNNPREREEEKKKANT